MAIATRVVTGSILIRVADQPPMEVAAFDVPVTVRLDRADGEAVITSGSISAEAVAALRAAADRLEAIPD